jgi:hypothetical protein
MNTHFIKYFNLTTLHIRNTAGTWVDLRVFGGIRGGHFFNFVFYVLFVFVLCLVHLILTLFLNYRFLIDPSVFSNVYLVQILSYVHP